MEIDAIRTLADADQIVIACGGGGIPVIEQQHAYQGASAVIEKDCIAGKLASDLLADELIILTSVDMVYKNFGKEDQEGISSMTVAEAQKYIDKARRCFEERGALWGKSKIHSYIALLAIERRDREEAETHYQMAKRIAQQGRNPSALSLVSEVEDKLRTFTDGRTASAGGA